MSQMTNEVIGSDEVHKIVSWISALVFQLIIHRLPLVEFGSLSENVLRLRPLA